MSAQNKTQLNLPEAFLIVDGVKVIVFDTESLNIGRKKDNDIIIDNPHTSRHHARIRFIDKKYVLFDLDSTVGTSVNGKRSQTTILKPGDVISIGGVPIIFGLGIPDSPIDISRPIDTKTGPTDSTDLEKLDGYLDLFNGKEDDD
ncbi:MAG: FHA domain-containing protein [Anaerolineales bacterium]|nr:FHA domain-containing protein [Chloroflexota bacterium]MBL6979621.1 FHA domain-containing protein [Anaerolineales bacterium]